MKIFLQLPINPFGGYGNDGIGITRALIKMGADVYLEPTLVRAPIPKDIAKLLTKPVQGPFDLSIMHVDPAILQMSPEVKHETKVTVGWTMWEWSTLDNMQYFVEAHEQEDTAFGYATAAKRAVHERPTVTKKFRDSYRADLMTEAIGSFRENLKLFDVIAGYDQNTVNGLAPYYDGPLVVVQGGFEPKEWPVQERDWDSDDFYFSMIGVLSARKNPFAALQAFGELKAEDAEFNKHGRLMLKTNAPGLHSGIEDIYEGARIFYDAWPKHMVLDYYKNTHVLLAPSWGEGKNMPALEFQSTGGPVIATGWGGHTGWLNPDYNFAIDYDLIADDLRFPNTMHAEVRIEHLKELMLHAFRNRDEMRQKGALAAQMVPKMSSWSAVLDRLMNRAAEATGDHTVLDALAVMRAQRSDKD